MPWRGHAANICKRCGRGAEECGPLSARYRCVECGEGSMLANVRELRAHTGPAVLRWRRGMAAAVGAVLLDEAPAVAHTVGGMNETETEAVAIETEGAAG